MLIAVAGWVNQQQLQIIDYLRKENRLLREQLGERRMRFTNDQRRRLAAKAKGLRRKLRVDVATAQKYDGGGKRRGDLARPERLRLW